MALRLLRRNQIIRPLDALGLTPRGLERVHRLLTYGEGIVLVSGRTGAGKTTTLYSLIHALSDGHRNIVTIENPIEYRVPGFVQMEADPKHDITMASGLKTLLRMDPDVLLLGEIRDPETTAAAMRAASCGKYVFCTFHARDAASIVTGLRDRRRKRQIATLLMRACPLPSRPNPLVTHDDDWQIGNCVCGRRSASRPQSRLPESTTV